MPCQGYLRRALLEAAGLVEMGAAVFLACKGNQVARTVITLISGTQDNGGAKVHKDYIVQFLCNCGAHKYIRWFDIQVYQIHLLMQVDKVVQRLIYSKLELTRIVHLI
jgi:hypothetical protein